MLTIYRRHRKNCKQCAKGRKYRHCQCPIWVDGLLGGKEMRESLKLRDWQRAQDLIREWEAEDRRIVRQEHQVTIKDAHAKFTADAEARKLNDATLYKYRVASFSFRASASAVNFAWASLIVTWCSCRTMRRSSASHSRIRSCARCQSRSFRDSRISFPPSSPSTQMGHWQCRYFRPFAHCLQFFR